MTTPPAPPRTDSGRVCFVCHRALMIDEKQWRIGSEITCDHCHVTVTAPILDASVPPSYTAIDWLAHILLTFGIIGLFIAVVAFFFPMMTRDRTIVDEAGRFSWNAIADSLTMLTASAVLFLLRDIARNTHKP